MSTVPEATSKPHLRPPPSFYTPSAHFPPAAGSIGFCRRTRFSFIFSYLKSRFVIVTVTQEGCPLTLCPFSCCPEDFSATIRFRFELALLLQYYFMERTRFYYHCERLGPDCQGPRLPFGKFRSATIEIYGRAGKSELDRKAAIG